MISLTLQIVKKTRQRERERERERDGARKVGGREGEIYFRLSERFFKKFDVSF
jgi:hypothetical protein